MIQLCVTSRECDWCSAAKSRRITDGIPPTLTRLPVDEAPPNMSSHGELGVINAVVMQMKMRLFDECDRVLDVE